MKRITRHLAAFSDARARAAGLRRGFTLVEVMVAIAIALALIVGISEIFAMAQRTTGGGNALLIMNNQERSIQNQLAQDFQGINVASDTSPGLVITSYAVPAFRNAQDKADSRDTSTPPDPRNLNNPGSGSPAVFDTTMSAPNGAYSTNGRIHRQDRLCMFVRGSFRRQTADSPNLVSPTSAQEAFVWYGHLALPNDAVIGDSTWDPSNAQVVHSPGAIMNPGVPSTAGNPKNDNNEFASQWILGRQAILLSPIPTSPTPTETAFRPVGDGEVPMSIIGKRMCYSYPGANPATNVQLFTSRYDLAYYTTADCLRAYQGLTSADLPWYQQVSGLQFNIGSSQIITDQRGYYANPFPTKPAAANFGTNTRSTWLSGAAALTAPIFVRGCTQFIVEYAGDYATQNQDSTSANFGQVTAAGGDGSIDFIPIKDINGNWTRQIRWYGAPRDTMAYDPNASDPNKRIPSPGQDAALTADGNAISYDVIPLSVFLRRAGFPTTVQFERNQAAFNSLGLPTVVSSAFPFNNVGNANNLLPMYSTPYVCAWDTTTGAANLPKLIRITIGIDDPNGRLNTEQTFEYIFQLPN